MPNFSSLARLEVPEKFLWWWGGVCKFIFMSNPTVVLRLGWGFDNTGILHATHTEIFFFMGGTKVSFGYSKFVMERQTLMGGIPMMGEGSPYIGQSCMSCYAGFPIHWGDAGFPIH